jgi:hypothetical protein
MIRPAQNTGFKAYVSGRFIRTILIRVQPDCNRSGSKFCGSFWKKKKKEWREREFSSLNTVIFFYLASHIAGKSTEF